MQKALRGFSGGEGRRKVPDDRHDAAVWIFSGKLRGFEIEGRAIGIDEDGTGDDRTKDEITLDEVERIRI